MAAAAGVGVAWLLRRRRFSETCANLTGEGKGEEEMREREREASKPEVLALKHESRILGQWSYLYLVRGRDKQVLLGT